MGSEIDFVKKNSTSLSNCGAGDFCLAWLFFQLVRCTDIFLVFHQTFSHSGYILKYHIQPESILHTEVYRILPMEVAVSSLSESSGE